MEQLRKITVEVSERDLDQAQKYSGEGITETVRAALREFTSRRAQKELLNYRGRVLFEMSLEDLKYDRR